MVVKIQILPPWGPCEDQVRTALPFGNHWAPACSSAGLRSCCHQQERRAPSEGSSFRHFPPPQKGTTGGGVPTRAPPGRSGEALLHISRSFPPRITTKQYPPACNPCPMGQRGSASCPPPRSPRVSFPETPGTVSDGAWPEHPCSEQGICFARSGGSSRLSTVLPQGVALQEGIATLF